MNILIDGQLLQTGEIRRGIGVYFRNVLENMVRNNAGDLWFVTTSNYYDENVIDEWVQSQITFIKDDIFRPSTDYSREDEYTDKLNEIIRENQIDLIWFPDPMMVNVLFPSKIIDCKAVITMYDLIPYVMPVKEWPETVKNEYLRRIDYLKNNNFYALSISEATDNDYRKIVGNHIKSKVTFLAANGDIFGNSEPYKKDKDYVLFTGGFDYRKNITKAIEAYALAVKNNPDSEIADSLFYIVCKCDEEKKRDILNSLEDDIAQRIVFTGYISDEELAGMYAGARVFFFPSLYEGFGLPILEAMRSGAYVLSADNSSLPEVCNNMADLCDASNVDDMADKLVKAFEKSGKESESEREKRIQYAKSYTWFKTAEETYSYFEEICYNTNENNSDKKFKIAIVTPWPNQRTGIANYASNIFPFLKRYFDVDLFIDNLNEEVDKGEVFNYYDLTELPSRVDDYDEILYQIGNNMEFHKNAFKMLTECKGIAEIHDFDLSSFFYNSYFLGGDKKLMRDALRLGYGSEAINFIDSVENQRQVFDGRYKMSDSVAAYADAVLFHNKWSALECRSHSKKYVVPHACFDYGEADEKTIEDIKKRINYSDSDVIIGMFGFINRNKRYNILVKAFKKLKSKNAKLVFWGNDPNGDLADLLKKEGLTGKVYIMGYMDSKEYRAGVKITDIVVNMRYPSMGESSGTLCEALSAGKPTIVTGINQYLEFPDEVCWKLPCNPNNEPKEVFTLFRMLEELTSSKELRKTLGNNAKEYARNVLSSELMAEKYYYTIKDVIEAKNR